jgi:molybdenum cofactor cytidylyltransferase
MTTAGVILAAGAGRRFGGVKQLALYDGEPLVRRACRTAIGAGLAPVIVVLGAHADIVRDAIRDLAVEPVLCPTWDEGMGASLRFGVEHSTVRIVDEFVVLLADQPLVTPAHIRALVDARRTAGADVAATDTGATIGVPAVFARSLLPALAALSGDRGARDIIAAARSRVVVPFADAAVDIDTPLR